MPPQMPSTLPPIRATRIAHATTLPAAAASDDADSSTPMFASANSGRTTKLLHGSRRCSTRVSGETASRESSARRSHSLRVGVGWGRIVLGPVGDPMRLLAHRVRPLERLRRRQQADDDARERRMEPRAIHRVPEGDSRGRRRRPSPGRGSSGRTPRGTRRRSRRRATATDDRPGGEERDDDDRPDVVDDRESEQERTETARRPCRREREHAERERDVRRHRDRPAAARRARPPTIAR